MPFLYIVMLALVILIDYYIAKQFESVANEKGHTESKYFHICFWLGLVGYLLVIALPDRNNIRNSGIQPSRYAVTVDTAEGCASDEEPLIWQSADQATAITVGDTNIKCANCHRVQFKGNRTCVQCGAKFIDIAK